MKRKLLIEDDEDFKRTKTRWLNMRRNCYNKNRFLNSLKVEVCDEWIFSFPRFVQDMGICPVNHKLVRIDNTKGYSKENCKYVLKGPKK